MEETNIAMHIGTNSPYLQRLMTIPFKSLFQSGIMNVEHICIIMALYCHSMNFKKNVRYPKSYFFSFLQLRYLIKSIQQNLDQPKASGIEKIMKEAVTLRKLIA